MADLSFLQFSEDVKRNCEEFNIPDDDNLKKMVWACLLAVNDWERKQEEVSRSNDIQKIQTSLQKQNSKIK